MRQILKAAFSRPLRQCPIAATFLAMCMVACLAFFMAGITAAQGANVALAGTWNGELGEGAAKLHLVLTITKASSGEFSGELNSVDQGATLPMDNITLKAEAFRFEVKTVGGVYEGKLNSAGTEITGTWTQSGVPPQPPRKRWLKTCPKDRRKNRSLCFWMSLCRSCRQRSKRMENGTWFMSCT